MSSPKFDQRVHAFGRYCVRTLLWKLAFLPLQSQFIAQVKKTVIPKRKIKASSSRVFLSLPATTHPTSSANIPPRTLINR